jgi:hypothetical protein
MKTFTKEELAVILEKHAKWLQLEAGGERANLRYADLRSADLSYANLSYADLRSADLRSADLSSANLSYANLRYADLRSADLSSANLSSETSLWSTIGNSSEIKTIQTDAWTITYTSVYVQIGCQRHTIKEWFAFDDEAISQMSDGALEWWKNWKPLLKKILKVSPATPIILPEAKE